MKTDNLWYARCVRHLLNASDALEAAAEESVQAKDENLFHQIHEMRMNLWYMVSNLIKNPKENKNEDSSS